MTIRFRPYLPDDFLRIRDFLVRSHDTVGEVCNWHIARWNFCRHVPQVFNDNAEAWAKTVGIWEDACGQIIVVVSSEGEDHGEVHFQMAGRNLPDALLIDMFEYAEAMLTVSAEGRCVLRPILPDGDPRLTAIALDRGYTRTGRSEVVLTIDPRCAPGPVLPGGFRFSDGREVGPELQSRAHAAAFQIPDDSKYIPRSRAAFRFLREAPDYRPDLDLYVITDSGEPVSFCCMWYDRTNRAGHLEPVGTDPAFRRLGLGRAVINEGLRRITAEGATVATVGSNQQFYKSIGFSLLGVRSIWEKTVQP